MTDTPTDGTPEDVAKAIWETAHRAAEDEIATLVRNVIRPLESRVKTLEDRLKAN
jgi:hypothetical protein